jgi:hypothetical protein
MCIVNKTNEIQHNDVCLKSGIYCSSEGSGFVGLKVVYCLKIYYQTFHHSVDDRVKKYSQGVLQQHAVFNDFHRIRQTVHNTNVCNWIRRQMDTHATHKQDSAEGTLLVWNLKNE